MSIVVEYESGATNMAARGAILNIQIITSCFRHATYWIPSKKLFISPYSRTLSAQTSGLKEINLLRRFYPQYSQVSRYYVKAKQKRGPSLRTWLSVGAGFIASAAGLLVYLGECVTVLVMCDMKTIICFIVSIFIQKISIFFIF